MDITSPAFRPRDRSRYAALNVLDDLRERILALDMAPGTVLSRQDLQKRFGVSSTPIRDALIALQDEGLVEIFPQHATLVSRIDLDLARQAQFLRRSLEQEAVRVLAHEPNSGLVQRLRTMIAQQKVFADAEDLESFERSDQSFHGALYDAARAPDLWLLMRRHSGQLDRLRRMHLPLAGRARDIIGEHAAVVDAIEAGDAEASQDRMRSHLSHTLAFSGELRERHPDYFRA